LTLLLEAPLSHEARRAQDMAHGSRGLTGHGAGMFILWLCVFSGGFVINEPAPYDLIMVPVIAGWFMVGGLRLYPQFAPAFLLMILFLVGGILGLTQATDLSDAPLFIAVTGFLIGTFIFYANLIGQDGSVLKIIRSASIASAAIVALIGILGYFGAIPGASNFTLYDRAKGTFQDPNVFGPFLLLPIALLAQDFLTKPLRRTIWLAPVFMILLFGVFLSFSRAAWGMTVFILVGLTVVVFIVDRHPRLRMRIIGLTLLGLVVLAGGLAIALSFESVAEIFTVRAKLVQPYDAARVGRFARYSLGFTWAFESPLGIGALQFRNEFPEDPHNIYMKSFLAHGWLGGLSYIAFTLWTLIRGFPLLFKDRDWTPIYRAAYITFVAHVLTGAIIDTDHWRHLYLLYGMVWGCFILFERERRGSRPRRPRATRTGSAHGIRGIG